MVQHITLTTSHCLVANTVTNHKNHIKVPQMAVQFNFFSSNFPFVNANFLFRKYFDYLLSLGVQVSLGLDIPASVYSVYLLSKNTISCTFSYFNLECIKE